MILDGWGIGKHGKGDVIFNTPTPYLDLLTATSAHSQLQASGEDVGLPDGQMGNSEVGHLNIGAGRIVYQDLVKINRACKDGSIMENPQVKAAYSYAKENGKKLHLMGLCSDGGVHSSLDHLFKLIEIGKAYGLKNQLFVHCYMDGRDTDPKSGKGFIEQVTKVCADNDAAIASIVGRFYAMDRDKRWERVKEGYDLIVNGTGKQATDMVQAMQESYDEGVTDEFIKPIHNASVNGCIEEGDVVIFINFRNDRAKEMTIVLTQEDMPEQGMKTIPGLQYYCMTPYDANFKGVHILFPKENVENTLGEYLSRQGKKLHLMGLTSDGGVHSSLDHLFKLIEIGKAYGLKNQVFVHCYMDGRDTDPRSGKGFIEQVTKVCAENDAAIASIVGRFYAMDRDKRWERVKEGYDLIVNGTGKQATDMVQAMQESYDEGVTDEFIKPIHNASVNGCIEEGDVVIFINFRNDRAKEMTIALTQEDMPEQGMKTIPGLQYYCMTPYDANFKGVHILFPKENVEDTLGEYLSKQGKKQLHTAETEKYAHVTFFFNGGREAPYEGEDRILVPSPKVATYDLKPEMSAYEVKDKLVGAINTQEYDFIVVNFANGDMVGHTGVYNAIAKAVWAVDNCVREVIEAAKANDYEAIIIADHGNADNAINPDGTPNTAHSLNPVPFIYVTNNNSATVKDGRLADVAPSILHIMGLEQPSDMTGENLISDNQ